MPSSASRICVGVCTMSSRRHKLRSHELKAIELPGFDVRLQVAEQHRLGRMAFRSGRSSPTSSPAASTPGCTRAGCTSHLTTRGSRCTTRPRGSTWPAIRSTPASRSSRLQALPRLHAGERLVPEPRERARLHRDRQAWASRRAGSRLLQRQCCGDEADEDRSSRSSAGRSFTTAVNWPTNENAGAAPGGEGSELGAGICRRSTNAHSNEKAPPSRLGGAGQVKSLLVKASSGGRQLAALHDAAQASASPASIRAYVSGSGIADTWRFESPVLVPAVVRLMAAPIVSE